MKHIVLYGYLTHSYVYTNFNILKSLQKNLSFLARENRYHMHEIAYYEPLCLPQL